MKNYSTKIEFILGLLGVLMHTFVVMFIVAYLASPETLEIMIEQTTGNERQMLLNFTEEVNKLRFIVYAGSAIIVFEWLAVFRIRKYTNRQTPLWAAFLILGSLYSYVYFGGLEPSILLALSGFISFFKFHRYNKSKSKH